MLTTPPTSCFPAWCLLSVLDVDGALAFAQRMRGAVRDAVALTDHALLIFLPPSLTGDDAVVGFVLTLSSADRGDLGLVVSPFWCAARTPDKWKAGQSISRWTAEVEAFAYGRWPPWPDAAS